MRLGLSASNQTLAIKWRARIAVGALVGVLICMSLGSLLSQSAPSGTFYTAARTTDGDVGTVLVHDLSTGQSRAFYAPREGMVFDVKTAPSGQLIAITTQILKFDVPPAEATVTALGRAILERKQLHILTEAGAEIATIPKVRSYAWSPNGQQIVYVTGDYAGLYEDFVNTDTWLMDLAEKKPVRISDDGYDVAWAKFDGNIYIWSREKGIAGRAIRYNVSTRRLEPTSHVSIYFSPAGEYYYHPGGGTGLQEDIYIAFTDIGLKKLSPVLRNLSGWTPIAWAPDADLLLMRVRDSSQDDARTIIYDPKFDSRTNVSNELVGWGNSSKELVIRDSDGSVQIRSLSQVTQ